MCKLVSKHKEIPKLSFKVNIDTFQWALTNNVTVYDNQQELVACGKLDHLKYLHSINTPLDEQLDWDAAECDYVDALIWLKSIHYNIDADTFAQAIKNKMCLQFAVGCWTRSSGCIITTVRHMMEWEIMQRLTTELGLPRGYRRMGISYRFITIL